MLEGLRKFQKVRKDLYKPVLLFLSSLSFFSFYALSCTYNLVISCYSSLFVLKPSQPCQLAICLIVTKVQVLAFSQIKLGWHCELLADMDTGQRLEIDCIQPGKLFSRRTTQGFIYTYKLGGTFSLIRPVFFDLLDLPTLLGRSIRASKVATSFNVKFI